MVDDAIGSLRALFAASLLVLALWLLSWPAAGEKLRLYSAAVELHAWLAVKERLSTLRRSVFELPTQAVVAEDIEWVRRVAPNEEEYPSPVPLTVDVTWPVARSHSLSLVPAGFEPRALTPVARVYRIAGDGPRLLGADAYALFVREPRKTMNGQDLVEETVTVVGVVAADHAAFRVPSPGLRQVRAALRDGNRPPRWADLRLLLAKYGFTGEPASLASRDAAVAGLEAEVDPRRPGGGVQVFGLPLSVAQFFFAVGLLLLLLSFAMIGPLLALRTSPARTHAQSWILVVPVTEGRPRQLLEWVLCAASLGWAASPLVVLLLQLRSGGGTVGWVFGLGALGLVASSVVQGLVAWELRVTRMTGGAVRAKPVTSAR